MLTVLVFIIGVYALFNWYLFLGWILTPRFLLQEQNPKTCISVVVAARNEEHHILKLLESLSLQEYPRDLWELILVDDHSTDATCDLFYQYTASTGSTNFSLVKNAATGKKAALETGISKAKGTLIMCTDADCEVPPLWLTITATFFNKKKAKFISGLVKFKNTKGIFMALQSIEFLSLIASGASMIFWKHFGMCNGANMAFEKAVFLEVGGYEGNAHISSGDDEFLLQKIAQRYPKDIYFLKHSKAVVQTQPCLNLKTFYQQRLRWVSKAKYHKKYYLKIFPLWIFTSNLSVLIAWFFFFRNSGLCWALIILWLIEGIFLTSVIRRLRSYKLWYYLPLCLLLYPLYVVISGILLQRKSYTWKGRKMKIKL